MVLPKRRGTAFEYQVAHVFEKFGFEWKRSGSSLGTDLYILKNGKFRFLVGCKKTGTRKPIYIEVSEIDSLENEAKEKNCVPLFCVGFRYTSPFVLTLEEIRKTHQTKNAHKVVMSDGIPLSDFLRKETSRERCSFLLSTVF
jgi:Holliday junction resolvase